VGLLAGPVVVAWAVVVAPALLAPMLLAAHAWIPAVGLVVIGAATARVGLGALHRLARRWVVFVPAGIVLHDPLVLADPVLFRKRLVRALRPAEVGDEAGAVDLTRGAAGLVLALDLTSPTPLGLVKGRSTSESAATSRLLFAPARPGAVLTEARGKGF